MKLSEAIRLGSMMTPRQAFNTMHEDQVVDGHLVKASCAWGAAQDAGYHGFAAWADFVTDPANLIECPACEQEKIRYVAWRIPRLVMHLNDHHHWTREHIADYVETIERSTATPVAEPEPALVTA